MEVTLASVKSKDAGDSLWQILSATSRARGEPVSAAAHD